MAEPQLEHRPTLEHFLERREGFSGSSFTRPSSGSGWHADEVFPFERLHYCLAYPCCCPLAHTGFANA